MTEPRTRPTGASVEAFIAAIPDDTVRNDCRVLVELMRRASHAEPQMWGESIVGFGEYELARADGSVYTWPCAAFAPRRRELVLYVLADRDRHVEGLLRLLGRYRTGKSCLYVRRLSDVDLGVLEQIVAASLESRGGCADAG